ncbi:hypothetical protein JKP88DRAFT_275665 [Tribonema minus]|uniref:GAF domain-containing protein n=1 Tax=Tribonema minus TaxID=303371 RepID=A0A835ZBR1_9STRA|nr:hypothetical protein JKP88DRAFT_275665 [Tribonema minus]
MAGHDRWRIAIDEADLHPDVASGGQLPEDNTTSNAKAGGDPEQQEQEQEDQEALAVPEKRRPPLTFTRGNGRGDCDDDEEDEDEGSDGSFDPDDESWMDEKPRAASDSVARLGHSAPLFDPAIFRPRRRSSLGPRGVVTFRRKAITWKQFAPRAASGPPQHSVRARGSALHGSLGSAGPDGLSGTVPPREAQIAAAGGATPPLLLQDGQTTSTSTVTAATPSAALADDAASRDADPAEARRHRASMIARRLRVDRWAAHMLVETAEAVACERAFVFLRDPARAALRFRRWDRGEGVCAEGWAALPMASGGVAGCVVTTGITLNVPDACDDPRVAAAAAGRDRAHAGGGARQHAAARHNGGDTRTLLCVPLRRPCGAVFGCVEVVNKLGQGRGGEGGVAASGRVGACAFGAEDVLALKELCLATGSSARVPSDATLLKHFAACDAQESTPSTPDLLPAPPPDEDAPGARGCGNADECPQAHLQQQDESDRAGRQGSAEAESHLETSSKVATRLASRADEIRDAALSHHEDLSSKFPRVFRSRDGSAQLEAELEAAVRVSRARRSREQQPPRGARSVSLPASPSHASAQQKQQQPQPQQQQQQPTRPARFEALTRAAHRIVFMAQDKCVSTATAGGTGSGREIAA